MRKKLLAVLLSSAMMAAALTGCGGNADSAPADNAAAGTDSIVSAPTE